MGYKAHLNITPGWDKEMVVIGHLLGIAKASIHAGHFMDAWSERTTNPEV